MSDAGGQGPRAACGPGAGKAPHGLGGPATGTGQGGTGQGGTPQGGAGQGAGGPAGERGPQTPAGAAGEPGATLGPATGRNWGLVLPLGAVAALLAASAVEATQRLGPGWEATALPLLLGAPFAAGAALVWRLPPFERCTLRLTPDGVAIAGRRETHHVAWREIGAVAHRPAAFGGAHMTLERAAGAVGPGVAPGLSFPVRATGARMEDIVAFLGRGAAASGYRLREAGRGGSARHALPGPRLWHVVPAGPAG